MTDIAINKSTWLSTQKLSSQYIHALQSQTQLTSLAFPTLEETVPFDQLFVTQTITEAKREKKEAGDDLGIQRPRLKGRGLKWVWRKYFRTL